MAYSTIPKGTDYFNTSLWTGNGSAKTISGVGFQPDLLWAKCRSNSYSHILTDAVRGITKQLKSEGNAAELTNAQGVTAFNADGYVLGTQDDFANNGNTFVGWGWKAGTTSGIVQGGASITPSAYSFNQTSGFSIIKYQGTGSNATVPHGLNAVPKMIIIKCLSLASKSWQVGHESIGWQNGIYLNLTDANGSDSGAFNSTNPTSSLFSLGTSSFVNTSSADYVAYCFSEIPGYSKFNRYDGNGSTNGSFIYTGFKPAFVMVKKSSATNNWVMTDNKRNPFNVATNCLFANLSDVEGVGLNFDLLSNGFKLRSNSGGTNTNAETYIYMAFAENPFVATSGTAALPVTAR